MDFALLFLRVRVIIRAAQDLFGDMPGRDYPRLRVVWGDGKYHNYQLYDWLSVHRRPYTVAVVNRPAGAEGCLSSLGL